MSNYRKENQNSGDDLGSWILIIIGFVVFWPVGLFLLFRKLTEKPGKSKHTAQHPYDLQREAAKQPGTQGLGRTSNSSVQQNPPLKRRAKRPGRALIVWGAIIASIFGLGCVSMIPHLNAELLFTALFPCLGFTGAGLAMICAGRQRSKKAKRYRRYLALIGRNKEISIAALAQAMPASVSKACDDLQEMLDNGILPTGYLDMGSGRLILSAEGLQDSSEPEPQKKEASSESRERDNAILEEIRAVNNAIADPAMSRKIDRIGEITGKIFAYQKQNPGKDAELRTFLSYYLPTTLRILKAYAQMEAQGVDGENIHAAKVRIEGMMDKVVEGYEKQLDMLFRNDAMDITADVEVLEHMLEKDGLSGDRLTLGG